MKDDGLSDIERLDLATLVMAIKSAPIRIEHGSWKYERPTYADLVVKNDGVVRGTFTGTVIQTTMPKRTGRGLMSPGVRIFDEVQQEERLMLDLMSRQKKAEELTKRD